VSACTDFPKKYFRKFLARQKSFSGFSVSRKNLLELFWKSASAKNQNDFPTNYFHRDFERLLLFVKGWIFLTHPLGSGVERRVNGCFQNCIRNGSRADDRSDHRVEGAATQKTAA